MTGKVSTLSGTKQFDKRIKSLKTSTQRKIGFASVREVYIKLQPDRAGRVIVFLSVKQCFGSSDRGAVKDAVKVGRTDRSSSIRRKCVFVASSRRCTHTNEHTLASVLFGSPIDDFDGPDIAEVAAAPAA